MVTAVLTNTYTYMLVFVRLIGMFAFSPLFSRRNAPNMVRIGLTLVLTLLIAPTTYLDPALVANTFDIVAAIVKELLIGLVCGFVFQIYHYMLLFIGDVLDTQFGMSMAKVFDPGTNIQMSITGNFLNILFMLYIFATDSHLVMIQIFATSFDIVSLGTATLSSSIATSMIELFLATFSLAFRLAIPFIATEFILEISMGVLMKLIPQIHVFVINIQLKMLLGIFLLLAFAGPISSFVDNYMRLMLEHIGNVIYIFA